MRQFIIMPFLMVFVAYVLVDTWYMIKSSRRVNDAVRTEKIDTICDSTYNKVISFNK